MLHLFILVKLFDKYIKLSKIISDNCFMSIVIIVVLNLKTIHTEPNQTSAKLLTIVILSRLLLMYTLVHVSISCHLYKKRKQKYELIITCDFVRTHSTSNT